MLKIAIDLEDFIHNLNMQLPIDSNATRLGRAAHSSRVQLLKDNQGLEVLPRGFQSPKVCRLQCLFRFPETGEPDLPDGRLDFADSWRAVVNVSTQPKPVTFPDPLETQL